MLYKISLVFNIMKYKIYILLILCLGFTNYISAQEPPPPECWPPPCETPLDGGLSFLLVAGAAFGAKKIYGVAKDK